MHQIGAGKKWEVAFRRRKKINSCQIKRGAFDIWGKKEEFKSGSYIYGKTKGKTAFCILTTGDRGRGGGDASFLTGK